MVELTLCERRKARGMLVILGNPHPDGDDDPSPPAAPARAAAYRLPERRAQPGARVVPARVRPANAGRLALAA
jgi:hypothetical protein